MKKIYSYDYTVSKDNSPKVFEETCKKVENAFPSADKKKLLVDVDGSTIQTYELGEKIIDVFDDYEVGAVYVKSDIDLSEILSELMLKIA